MIYVIHMIQHDFLFSSFSLRLTPARTCLFGTPVRTVKPGGGRPYTLRLGFIYIYSETPIRVDFFKK